MAKLKTGRHTSALKEHRKAVKRTARNAATKTRLRGLSKDILAAVKGNDTALAKKLLTTVFSELDRAGQRHVIHFKNAGNQKARLSRVVASMSAAKK